MSTEKKKIKLEPKKLKGEKPRVPSPTEVMLKTRQPFKPTFKPEDYSDRKKYWAAMRKAAFKHFNITDTGKKSRKAFSDPIQLWEMACCYFEYCDANPLSKNELIKSGDLAGSVIPVTTPRPYTWQGFRLFLIENGVTSGLDEYRFNKNNDYSEFVDVVALIDEVMYNQKFEYAMINTFNAQLTQRVLKIADQVENTVKAEVATKEDIDYSKLSDAALEEIANAKITKTDGQ